MSSSKEIRLVAALVFAFKISAVIFSGEIIK